MIGSIDGSNLKIIGVSTPVGKNLLIRSRASRMELDASIKSVPYVNSKMTKLDPLLDIELTFSKPDTPESIASNGRVTERSTSSGPAPVYEVITARNGGLISGYKSIGKFTRAKSPNPIRRAKIIKIVVGRETTDLTNFMKFSPFL
jgi:hypothetical protein